MSTICWAPTSSQRCNGSSTTMIVGSPGSGKALSNNEKILKVPGELVYVKNIQVNDYIYDRKGNPTRVLGVYPQGKKWLYKVICEDGRSIVCSESHIFSIIIGNKLENKTVRELLKLKDVYLPNLEPINYSAKKVLLNPFLLGIFLKYNNLDDTYVKLNIEDKKVLNEVLTAIQIHFKTLNITCKDNFIYKNDKKLLIAELVESKELIDIIKYNKKYIPKNYIYSSIQQREQLLKVFNNKLIEAEEEELLLNLQEISRSLGYYSRIKNNKLYIKKVDKLKIKKIEELGCQEECTCFYVDNNEHLFIAGDYIVTHNTFFMLNTAASCLGMGEKVFAIDPKNDFSKLKNINPNIEIIDINKIRPGALNPFTFLDSFDTSTLMTIIEIMCGNLNDDDLIDITPIIQDFVTKFKRDNEYKDMQDVADYLYSRDSKSSQKVGTLLKMFEDSTYGKLLFTREMNVKPLRLTPEQSIIISLHGMSLPDYKKDPKDYDANERFTSTILYIITTKLLEILSKDNIIPVNLFCDEAHLLFGNKDMSKIIDRFMVLGRSLNVAVILASQGVSHFPEGISQYVTSKFIFKSSIEEAQLFLDKFNIAKFDSSANNSVDEESVISAITKLKTGSCWFIDRLNRNTFVRIISNYDIELLTSNPFEKKRDDD